MDTEQCKQLCKTLRKTIFKTVMKNGGHLASNLGVVELTVAIHKVFDSPNDKIIWDVGHQSYAHKLLTGRADRFETLRKEDGISGFARPSESEHDSFISGHSSTSISAALGIAEAMKLNGDTQHKAIAVIGDGAFTGGLAYEGLNNAGKSNSNIIVILNHNDMSISKNVGALAKYLTKIRGNQKYLDTKKRVEQVLDSTPLLGEPLKNILVTSKSALKVLLYHSTMFEELGFVYLGPVNGHNFEELENTLKMAQRIKKPVFIHVNTQKGKGYKPAEINPGEYHSVSASGKNINNAPEMTFSDNFGQEIARLAEKDVRICAISAAMKYGTGLQYFAAKFPQRFFDVGIAEQHAVTFGAGLAKGGKIPVFSVYSSFLQRSYDQLIHDAAIDKLHLVLAVDRAGFVGEDGETHQGMFDIPMLRSIPNVTIYSPSSFAEQTVCLNSALYNADGIAVVRYPKGKELSCPDAFINATDNYHLQKNNTDFLAVGFGRTVNNLYSALDNESGIKFDVLKLVKIFPIDNEIISQCMRYRKIVFFEESLKYGGISEYITAKLMENGYSGAVKTVAVDNFVPQATIESSMSKYGLDAESMRNTAKRFFYEV